MKQKVFTLAHKQAADGCAAFIQSIEPDGKTEVVIRDAQVGKTLQQLGALFGVWIDYIVDQTGYTVNEVHRDLKRLFLGRIYAEEQHGKAQESWVNMLLYLQEKQDWKGVALHADTISLKWATCKQMKKYMDYIQQYYISHEMPLPIPDKYWKVYR